jgi:hypothetical protein
VLRDHGVPVLENVADKTKATGSRVWDAVNKEWIQDNA